MKVRMKVSVSGHRVEADGTSRDWPERGGVIDVSEAEGAALCATGMAEPVKEPAVVETAVPDSGGVETAAMTAAPPKAAAPAKRTQPRRGAKPKAE